MAKTDRNPFHEEMEKLGVTPDGNAPKTPPPRHPNDAASQHKLDQLKHKFQPRTDFGPIDTAPLRALDAQSPPPPAPLNQYQHHYNVDGAVEFARSGVQKKLLRDLKRGKFRPTETLDLHEHTQFQAREALAAFLASCVHAGDTCVRVIHGKGLHSGATGSVLKPLVVDFLKARPEVIAFCPAQPRDGGTGALYVRLRRK